MRSSQERQAALVEEVKNLLKEKGKPLDPEILARLTASEGRVVEDGASRFAAFWRGFRVIALLLLIGLFALLFFWVSGPGTGGHQGATRTTNR